MHSTYDSYTIHRHTSTNGPGVYNFIGDNRFATGGRKSVADHKLITITRIIAVYGSRGFANKNSRGSRIIRSRETGYPDRADSLRVCRRLIGYVNTRMEFIGEREKKIKERKTLRPVCSYYFKPLFSGSENRINSIVTYFFFFFLNNARFCLNANVTLTVMYFLLNFRP